jgi:hypothetical protein
MFELLKRATAQGMNAFVYGENLKKFGFPQ